MVVFLYQNLDHRILAYVKKILKVPSKSNVSFWRKILKVTLELYFPANTKEYQQTTDNSFSFFLCAGKYNLNGTFSIFLQKSTFYWMCKTPMEFFFSFFLQIVQLVLCLFLHICKYHFEGTLSVFFYYETHRCLPSYNQWIYEWHLPSFVFNTNVNICIPVYV